jgi:4-hydroxy-3-methylbut-2-enyl diphosphate reductase
LASPRGYCAGVERAVDTVERALQLYGKPVYVRKQIVHNSHVVRELEERGAVFVDSVDEIPEGSTVVFSAHGVAPAVREAADARQLTSIDATCPLVTKVHTQARRYAEAGYTIVLIGHAGHEEVEGTMGEALDATVIVESVADAEALDLPAGSRLAYITQTTLSVDETREIIEELRRRFPQIEAPAREDICYATSNRQWAVKELLDQVGLLLVVGSRNSSNSVRLVEVSSAAGVPAYLVDDAGEIDERWLDGIEVVGVTSGCAIGSASTASPTSASTARCSRTSCSSSRSSCAAQSARQRRFRRACAPVPKDSTVCRSSTSRRCLRACPRRARSAARSSSTSDAEIPTSAHRHMSSKHS